MFNILQPAGPATTNQLHSSSRALSVQLIILNNRTASFCSGPLCNNNIVATRKPLKLTQLHALLSQQLVSPGTARKKSSVSPSSLDAPHPDRPSTPEPCDKTLLIVDDLELNQKILKKLVARVPALSHTNIMTASNGEAAVEIVRTTRFNLIFMMDGYQATKLIREYEQANCLDPTPIIAVTANADLETRERCLKVGFTEVFIKPILNEHLVQIAEKYVIMNQAPT